MPGVIAHVGVGGVGLFLVTNAILRQEHSNLTSLSGTTLGRLVDGLYQLMPV